MRFLITLLSAVIICITCLPVLAVGIDALGRSLPEWLMDIMTLANGARIMFAE